MNIVEGNSELKRKCSDCSIVFDLNSNNFHRSKSRKFGFEYKCKKCEKIRSKTKTINRRGTGRFKKLTQEKKNKKYEISKKYYKTKNGRARITASAYKKFDKNNHLDNNITWDFILNEIMDMECYYCGVRNGILGCDRIDNNKGHLMDNVVPCCSLCNATRLDNFSCPEMKKIGEVISQIRKDRESSGGEVSTGLTMSEKRAKFQKYGSVL